MPIYQYHCRNCGADVEQRQSFSANPLVECPNCHHLTLKRVLQPAGIIFKGSGWYITDSKKSSSAVTPPGEKSDNGKANDNNKSGDNGGSSTSESKSGESKTSESKSNESKATESKPAESKQSAAPTATPAATPSST